jgi:plastocyanin
MRYRTLTAVLAAAAMVAAAVLAPLSSSGAAGPQAEIAKKKCRSKQKKKVKVGDDFYAPTNVKIKKCGKVKWKWLPTNGNPHNVTLTKGPKKVNKKHLTSATGSIGIKFARKFKKPGRYDFVCTIHPTTMQMTVKVKKKK